MVTQSHKHTWKGVCSCCPAVELHVSCRPHSLSRPDLQQNRHRGTQNPPGGAATACQARSLADLSYVYTRGTQSSTGQLVLLLLWHAASCTTAVRPAFMLGGQKQTTAGQHCDSPNTSSERLPPVADLAAFPAQTTSPHTGRTQHATRHTTTTTAQHHETIGRTTGGKLLLPEHCCCCYA